MRECKSTEIKFSLPCHIFFFFHHHVVCTAPYFSTYLVNQTERWKNYWPHKSETELTIQSEYKTDFRRNLIKLLKFWQTRAGVKFHSLNFILEYVFSSYFLCAWCHSSKSDDKNGSGGNERSWPCVFEHRKCVCVCVLRARLQLPVPV